MRETDKWESGIQSRAAAATILCTYSVGPSVATCQTIFVPTSPPNHHATGRNDNLENQIFKSRLVHQSFKVKTKVLCSRSCLNASSKASSSSSRVNSICIRLREGLPYTLLVIGGRVVRQVSRRLSKAVAARRVGLNVASERNGRRTQ